MTMQWTSNVVSFIFTYGKRVHFFIAKKFYIYHSLRKIRSSDMFDEAWYRKNTGPSLPVTSSAALHYLLEGGKGSVAPGPLFDGRMYLIKNPDVVLRNNNPLLHYIEHGRREGREIHSVADTKDTWTIWHSGLFDAGWYRTHSGENLDDLELASHYLVHGRMNGTNPGPLFDGAWYLLQYPDVAQSKLNPLLHYLDYGRAEGRLTQVVGASQSDGRFSNLQGQIPSEFKHDVRVAVVVHAFYPELFDDICRLINNIPINVNIFVGVPSREGVDIINKLAVKHQLSTQPICRIVPNRGRNFSTLFSAFEADVVQHDLILHLHTKRSLFTGSEQTGWRNYLYNGLAGSEPLVRIVLGLFENDPKLGLFYPATYPDMPYWAHHWLSNRHHGNELLRRLGMSDFRAEGYFEYPVGGMFWARVDAVRDLLLLKFQYEEFDEEAGQTDGTLAHAMERVIGILPRARGFGFVEYDANAGALRHNWGTRNLTQYIQMSLEYFKNVSRGTNLISFDIFDTLVTRPALSPDAIIHLVGHKLKTDFPFADYFFHRRKGAEHKARSLKEWKGDVDLDEIYASFERDSVWTSSLINRALRLERITDLASIRIRPGAREMLRAARASGARIIAISDTYYTSGDIDQILTGVGLQGELDQIYLSSVTGARKDRRDLWAHVRDVEKIEPAGWLHVGDNEHSDIQAACDLGIRYFHVMNPALMLANDGFVRCSKPLAASWASELVVGPAMLSLTGAPHRGVLRYQHHLKNAYDVGYVVFGPVIFLFIAWLIRHPAIKHMDHLFFLSREGLLLQKIYEIMRKKLPRHSLPQGTYFYASRRATLCAAQAAGLNTSRIMSGAGFRGSFQALLQNRLGLVLPEEFNANAWEITLPDDEAYVLESLNTISARLMEQANLEKDAFLAYSKEQGMVRGKRMGVVDIGYSATIQKNIQDITSLPLTGFYLAAFDAAKDVEAKGGFAFGCLAEDVQPWKVTSPAIQHSLLLEAFLTAPEGQLLSYGSETSTLSFKPSSMSETEQSELISMHEGAVAYCSELVDTYGPEILFADMETSMPQEFIRMLVNGDISVPASVAKMLRVEDDHGGNGHVSALMPVSTHAGLTSQ